VNPLIEPLRIPSPKHHRRGKPTIVATDHNLITVEFFSSLILFATGIHFLPVILYDQGYPKVCPDSLNLPNAGDPFAGISSLSSCSLFSPTRDLMALI
jgi:hypothetical protein